ncbi:hypothetical protein GEMRC1_004444 [Eukaryota sp. GEM-RC1]
MIADLSKSLAKQEEEANQFIEEVAAEEKTENIVSFEDLTEHPEPALLVLNNSFIFTGLTGEVVMKSLGDDVINERGKFEIGNTESCNIEVDCQLLGDPFSYIIELIDGEYYVIPGKNNAVSISVNGSIITETTLLQHNSLIGVNAHLFMLFHHPGNNTTELDETELIKFVYKLKFGPGDFDKFKKELVYVDDLVTQANCLCKKLLLPYHCSLYLSSLRSDDSSDPCSINVVDLSQGKIRWCSVDVLASVVNDLSEALFLKTTVGNDKCSSFLKLIDVVSELSQVEDQLLGVATLNLDLESVEADGSFLLEVRSPLDSVVKGSVSLSTTLSLKYIPEISHESSEVSRITLEVTSIENLPPKTSSIFLQFFFPPSRLSSSDQPS